MRSRRFLRVSTGLGLGLLLFWPFVNGRRPTIADYQLSETPVARIPLDAIRDTGKAHFVFTVPTGQQWERIRSHWGDPGITVFAAPDSNSVFEFTTLGLDVRVHNERGRVMAEPVRYLPYMRSLAKARTSAHDEVTGWNFVGTPGEDLTVVVSAGNPESLPDGEIIVKYEWSMAQKDHIIAPPVEQEIERIASWAVGIGVALLAVAAVS